MKDKPGGDEFKDHRVKGGTWNPWPWLHAKDGRRVYLVMAGRRHTGRWEGIPSIVKAVRGYEARKNYKTIGAPRIRRAIHWLVEEGFIRKGKRRPFSRTPSQSKIYEVVDLTVTCLPDQYPAHQPTRRKKKRG